MLLGEEAQGVVIVRRRLGRVNALRAGRQPVVPERTTIDI
jgi:hypothetical protein